jgi:hypothetical protein
MLDVKIVEILKDKIVTFALHSVKPCKSNAKLKMIREIARINA